MFGLYGILSPSPSNVNKQTMHVPKQWRHFAYSLRVLTHTRGISQNLEKVPESWLPQDSGSFSYLLNSTCKYSYGSWEVPQLFPPRRSHMDPHSTGRKLFRHFASLFKGITGRISQNLAFFQICEIPLASALTLCENAATFAHPGVQTKVRTVMDLCS